VIMWRGVPQRKFYKGGNFHTLPSYLSVSFHDRD
jgi:hypothetical protein